jgi:amino acid adenylation domain-containing protein
MFSTDTPPTRNELANEDLELLAFLLEEEGLEPPKPEVSPRRPGLEEIPLSFGQERLWFLDQMQPGSPLRRIASDYQLIGPLDVPALEQSLNELVRRHEALRTTFSVLDGRPVQTIAPTLALTLPIVDLRDLPESARRDEAQRLIAQGRQEPFDLAQGPLLRTTLLQLQDEEHILLLCIHHIVTDGWSMGILRRELGVLYNAFSAGEPSPLPDLPIQYADYTLWQREWLQGEVLESQLGYWRKQLEGAPQSLELPTDRPRPPVQTYQGGRRSLVIPERTTRALKALSQRENATLFMTMLAAFNVLLARLTGQEDIVIGIPIAGRNRPQTEGLIGFFLNSLVLRTDLSGQPTFVELMRRVRATALAAYEHQDIPFEKLLAELQPERDLSRTPYFQIFFNMVPPGDTLVALQGLRVGTLPGQGTHSNFDLTTYVYDRRDGIHVHFVYNTDIFDESTIESMLQYYQNVLAHIVAEPGLQISALRLLSDADRRWLASQGNAIEPSNNFAEFKADLVESTIVKRFETVAQAHATSIAVRTGSHEWTYEELNRKANEIARAILAMGGKGSERVALMFAHDAPMLAAMLGALKAGRSYVPLDPYYPQRRLAHIVNDSMSGTVLVNDGTSTLAKELLSEAAFQIINIDDHNGAAVNENLNLSLWPDSIAYILYTSGTTGEPKGVVQNHRNVLQHIRVYTNNLHIAPQDRLTLLSTYGFDASVMDIYGSLLNGATLYPLDLRSEGLTSIARWLWENEISIYHSTPTVYRHFINTLAPGTKLPKVRLVVLGGEQVFKDDLEGYKEHFVEGSIFVNGFGPTESTLTLQSFLNHDSSVDRSAIPIGYPVANTEILLVNNDGLDAEVFGEIAIRSPHIALGYWQKPDATDAAFLPDPDGGTKRIYRTGDMGRLLPDGQIEFIGRKDSQVKIRGFRVELSEIEAQLVRHPSIQEAAAIAHEHPSGDTRIAAFVVAEDGQVPATQGIRRFLATRLPDYMLPASIQFMPEMPLTRTGKLDRGALPEPDWSRPELEHAFVAPRTSTEETLARIWAHVLGLERVSVHDNFFEVGGHSLLAVRLLSRINRELGTDLPLATLFQAPSVEQMAEILCIGQQAAEAWSSLVAMKPTGSLPPLFVAPGNLGNVFTDLGHLARHLAPEQPFYGFQDGIQNPWQIEALAAHYIAEMRMVQRRGPYLIGGVCSGGLVAFEMARQLRAKGQEVRLLALVEPSPPPDPSARAYLRFVTSNLRRLVGRIGEHARMIVVQSPKEQLAYLRLKRRVMVNSWAGLRYIPQLYPGRIELFLTERSLARSGNRQLAWRDFAEEGIRIHAIPGSHATIVGLGETPVDEAHMQALADKLNACIGQAIDSV